MIKEKRRKQPVTGDHSFLYAFRKRLFKNLYSKKNNKNIKLNKEKEPENIERKKGISRTLKDYTYTHKKFARIELHKR